MAITGIIEESTLYSLYSAICKVIIYNTCSDDDDDSCLFRNWTLLPKHVYFGPGILQGGKQPGALISYMRVRELQIWVCSTDYSSDMQGCWTLQIARDG